LSFCRLASYAMIEVILQTKEENMPSFDLVSKLDMGEVKNVLNMALKQIQGRYDFKGSETSLELKGETIEIVSEDETKLKAALDILRSQMAKRGMAMKSMEVEDPKPAGLKMLKQVLNLKFGIDKEAGKKINKLVKESGAKVQSSYMDEKVRLTGKKIDDLQATYRMLKDHDDVKIDLQMENMKR